MSTEQFILSWWCFVVDGSLSGLCQEVLQEIAEYREEGRRLYPHAVFVYVNLCDVDGIPTHDRYV